MRWLRPTSFRAQIVASTMVLMTLLVGGAGLVLLALLELTAHHEVGVALSDRTSDVVGAVDRASTSSLVAPDGSLDQGEAVYDQGGRLVAGSVERRAQDAAVALSGATAVTNQDVADDLRMRATPITTSSGLHGVVVVTQVTTPYENSERYALLAILVLGVLAVGTTGLIARRVTSQALRPVRLMAETASEWSETDLGRRFALGGPDNEITALGETLDHLLERVARAIRSEQRLTSELAHELRTPLTVISGSADLALMRQDAGDGTRSDLEQIATSARAMAETISTLLDLARDLSAASADTCSTSDLVDGVTGLVSAPLRLEVRRPPDDVRLAAPLALAVRALAPLVDNAARFARAEVCVEVRRVGEDVDVTVLDDGPGVAADLVDTLFEPGTSGTGGTGLGLAIARRVARTLGGDVRLGEGGVVLRLPAA